MVIVASSQEGAFAPTQPRQSQSQHASQPDESSHQDIWGVLVPFSQKVETISFQRWKHRYYIGRHTEEHETDKYRNDVLLYGLTVSGFHCAIEWDGDESENTTVTVKDFSSNGTYINGRRIPKNILTVLNNGDEIAFGQCEPHTGEHEHMDYRYIYRHRAYSPPTHGLYKSYNMRRELGRGTFATVVKALHRAEGKFYAVKVIEASMLRGDWSRAILGHAPERLDEISREIAILQRLEHRNICALKEFFLEGYTLNLVLELVPGGDLLHYLLKNHREDRMSERMAQYFTYQMCDALAYVHDLGIAHRDLKPENVLLTSDSPPVVKIADFGLAKAVDEKTMLRTVCGTPAYLAPEVVTRGSEGYGLLVDCWSVGVIVFSMITMLVPFLDDPSTDVDTRIANRVVQWDILRACGISLEGEDFLHGLLENDPRQRLAMADACIHPWLAEQAHPECRSGVDTAPA
ncbi:kinase-like domain-containing protein [Trametes elegans]|nr:kinase-like domain-containing protein [Trametes elegans]